MSNIASQQFQTPGKSSGLIEVFRQPYLTSLIVHKELRARYRGSIFGMLWSYAKPLTQFLVFYFALGVFMKMNRAVENYVIYMFSGVVLMNYFSEVFGNATRSVVGNAPLVKKIYLPRELFPMSAMWVALVHFLPQVAVLFVGALLFGWHPTVWGVLAILAAFLIVSMFALGIGLFSGALNVLDAHGWHWLWWVYEANPLTIAVELFHYGFWQPTLVDTAANPYLPNLGLWTGIALLISLGAVIFGEVSFRRMDPKFAQEL